MSTRTRFEKEARDNSEMAYCLNCPASARIISSFDLIEYVWEHVQSWVRAERKLLQTFPCSSPLIQALIEFEEERYSQLIRKLKQSCF